MKNKKCCPEQEQTQPKAVKCQLHSYSEITSIKQLIRGCDWMEKQGSTQVLRTTK